MKAKISRFSNFDPKEVQPDVFICALGYEARCTHFLRNAVNLPKNIVAISFPDRKKFSYRLNRIFLEENGAEIYEVTDGDFFTRTVELLSILSDGKRQATIAVDISGFTRFRISELTRAFSRNKFDNLNIEIIYSLREYHPPARPGDPIRHVEPMSYAFSGWTAMPDLPTSLIIGLGHEEGRAAGVAEYLEAAETWVFFPAGGDERFEHDVRLSNDGLLEVIEPNRLISYDVGDPGGTLSTLLNIVAGNSDVFRPLLLPGGPKIFAYICCIACQIFDYSVPVWRVSSGLDGVPVDVDGDGRSVGFRYSLTNSIVNST